tara:strand:- start:30001 stop:30165 length:165 start_codon:yes stop_codon:yes gene_type:complete
MEIVNTNKATCSECDNDILEVLTENKDTFNFGDKVTCLTCNHEGIVDEDGSIEI